MASRIEIVPRSNCVGNLRKNEPVDLEPLKDIRETPEDRVLYPNDWMSVIFMTQKVYDDLLKLLKGNLQSTVPRLHPNKALWVTLRHMIIGDTVRPSEEAAVVGVCKSIDSVMLEEFYPPGHDFAVGAAEFEAIWGVPCCFGAIAATVLESDHVDQNYYHDGCTEPHEVKTHWIMAIDATLKVIYQTVATGPLGGTFEQTLDTCALGRTFNENSSTAPYTFVGDYRQLEARKWLRVATHGRDEENKEIGRGLKPARITVNLLLSRFGALKLKHPFILNNPCMILSLPILHNYFMRKNPAYGDLNRLLKEFKAEPEQVPRSVPVKPLPRIRVEKGQELMPVDIKDAMLRMKMDEKSLQALKDKAEMSDFLLHEFLSFVGMGRIDEQRKMGAAMGLALVPLQVGLPEYAMKLPIPSRKWLKIANEFEAKRQIPNCAGVIATRRVSLCADPKLHHEFFAVLVMIVDANFRFSHAELVADDPSVAKAVTQLLDKPELNLPKDKSLVFIGSEGLKQHRLLVRPGDTGHLTEAQVNRGLMISEKLMDTLVDRFAVLENSVAKKTAVGVTCATFVCSILHNFLMDQGSVYAEGFKN